MKMWELKTTPEKVLRGSGNPEQKEVELGGSSTDPPSLSPAYLAPSMKPFRLVSCALLALTVISGPAIPAGAAAEGEHFRSELASRVQELSKKGVTAVVGVDQWLFLVAEMRFLSHETFWGPAAAKVSHSPKPDAADPLPAIVDFQKQLKARGIELLLVPVPPKAAIYPEKLVADTPLGDPGALEPLQHFYAELAASGVDVLDLSAVFARERAGADALFCKTDSHWSGTGCVLAAKAISDRVRATLNLAPSSNPYATQSAEVEITGDLGALLPASAKKPAKETLRLRQVTLAGKALEPDPKSPVLLMGDSHTLVFHDFAGEKAGLLDQLALELGTTPDLIGTRGSGATAVRVSLYRKSIRDPDYLTGKKIVIWCFTAREFTESEQGWGKIPISK